MPRNPALISPRRAGRLAGAVRVPGDRLASHCALVLGALATGRTRIAGLLEADDVIGIVRALTALGVPVRQVGDTWEVLGRGVGGLAQPTGSLDSGASGDGACVLLGAVAGQPITVALAGHVAPSMQMIGQALDPLRQMGLQVLEGDGATLPLTVRGCDPLVPLICELPFAAPQATAAVLIAGLAAAGETTVVGTPLVEPVQRMLRRFGAVVRSAWRGGKVAITVEGEAELAGCDLVVPGDHLCAAALTAAALIVPGSEIVLQNVPLGPAQAYFYDTLRGMGADIAVTGERDEGGEVVAELRVRAARLTGVRVPPERAAALAGEAPLLAVLAAFAEGETRFEGLDLLDAAARDRLAATTAGLVANGVPAEFDGRILSVGGKRAGAAVGGGRVVTHGDRHVALAFEVLSRAAEAPVIIDDADGIAARCHTLRTLLDGALTP